MEKLDKKLKHNHTLTNILKFTIFAMVMLAPIFSVASRCLYVICNKNANQSYSGNNGAEIILRNNLTTLQSNTKYYFNTGAITGEVDTSENIQVIQNTSILKNNSYLGYENQMITFRLLRTNANYMHYYTEENNVSTSRYADFSENNNISFYFYVPTTTTLISSYLKLCIYQVNPPESTLDNAFEYSLSQIENSSYYNWATNLGIYTPIYNMVNGLGGHDIIALLLAYWSIYTAIYIVFDIIIVVFVKITHMIGGE